LRPSTIFFVIIFLCAASPAFPATITFNGVFTSDDDVQTFQYRVQNTGLVTISTTSYATGGFEPVLTLFDGAGNFQFFDDGSAHTPAGDAVLSWTASLANQDYIIALTQYDNYANGNFIGGNLSDGFVEQGNGNFTADLPFNNPVPGGSFLLPGGGQRTGSWSISFTSADPSLTVVPEPGSGVLLLAGAGLVAWKRSRKPA
jgi:hypothetical protein